MMRDHRQSELGVLALLGIALFLISEVVFTYLIYGFLGNGAFGPWALVACPTLVYLVFDILRYTLGVYTSMTNQVCILRLLAKRKSVSSTNEEHNKEVKQAEPLLEHVWVEDEMKEGHSETVEFLVSL